MIATSLPAFPVGYRITSIEVIVPLSVVAGSHLLWPFALNPWFLSFSVGAMEHRSSEMPTLTTSSSSRAPWSYFGHLVHALSLYISLLATVNAIDVSLVHAKRVSVAPRSAGSAMLRIHSWL